MDNDLNRILEETFNDYNYNNNDNNYVAISTSEANNVNNIFMGNEIKTECIICYEEKIPCIKCFQCTAYYCKICLTKLASESNKCICSIEFKINYSKIKKYNQELIKKRRHKKEAKAAEKAEKAKEEKAKAEKAKEEKVKAEKAKAEKAKAEKAEKAKKVKEEKAEKENNNSNNSNNSNSNSNPIITNLALKLEFLKDLTNNKIYNIDFKSFNTKIGSNIPNFNHYWDYQNKLLIFYAIPNSNQDLKNIVINYNILDANYQSQIYVWLYQLLKLPFHIYKSKWNNIANMMSKITHTNKILIFSNFRDICKEEIQL